MGTGLAPRRAASLGAFLGALLLTPFLVTAAFRVADWMPLSAPFGVLLATGVGLVVWGRGPWRAAGIGVAVGTVLYGLFLLWLFATLGQSFIGFD